MTSEDIVRAFMSGPDERKNIIILSHRIMEHLIRAIVEQMTIDKRIFNINKFVSKNQKHMLKMLERYLNALALLHNMAYPGLIVDTIHHNAYTGDIFRYLTNQTLKYLEIIYNSLHIGVTVPNINKMVNMVNKDDIGAAIQFFNSIVFNQLDS